MSYQATADLATDLANRTAEHLLMLSDSTTQDVQDLQVAYNNNSKSQYNSTQFYRIMINTGAAKHLTAGYSQFQALQCIIPVDINYSTKGMVSV